jgi:DNA-binding NtrC family response regulator
MPPRVLWISDTTRLGGPQPGAAYLLEQSASCDAPERVRRKEYDAAVIELPLCGKEPGDLVLALHAVDAALPLLIDSPATPPSEAVRLARLGVWQFLDSFGDRDTVLLDAARARRRQRDSGPGDEWERLLVGESREMRQVGHIIRMIGPRRSTVLITGETGTGKEIAARALHLASPRRRGPLVALNCSAVPANLVEAELFGHVRGAFTGAVAARLGRFEEAHGGTLFLDEVGELPIELQAKLLRVLQEREVQRLGSSENVRVDIRVVAATNADLARKVEDGQFREDLYYRLNVVPLAMPPLRERQGDIPLLVSHLVEKICAAEGLPTKSVTGAALERLAAYGWPGNVRQLENALELAIALSGDRPVLDAGDFRVPHPVRTDSRAAGAVPAAAPVISLPEDGLDFELTLSSIERSILEQALRRTGGNKKAAAEMLHLKRTTLAAKVRMLETTSPCS